jgi:cytochrome c
MLATRTTKLCASGLVAAVVAMLTIAGCSSRRPADDIGSISAVKPTTYAAKAPTNATEAENLQLYITRVQPILQASCYRCHGGINHRGGLSIQTRAGMLRGGHDGTVLVPGDPEDSLLVKLMRHQGPANDPMPMPPLPRPKVPDADIDVVAKWVRGGAMMPE